MIATPTYKQPWDVYVQHVEPENTGYVKAPDAEDGLEWFPMEALLSLNGALVIVWRRPREDGDRAEQNSEAVIAQLHKHGRLCLSELSARCEITPSELREALIALKDRDHVREYKEKHGRKMFVELSST